MNDIHVTETLPLIPLSTVLLISFLAGLLQSASPDRWIPLSIHSWQRGWDARRTLLAGAGLLVVHVALGVALFGVIFLVAAPVSSESLSLVAVAVVLGGAVLRLSRFKQFRQVLGAGVRGRWGVPAVLSLMGPCELAIPLLLKTAHGGQSVVLALMALTVGTLVGALGLALGARHFWNQPARLATVVDWTQGRGVAVPAAAMALIVLQFLV